MIPPETLARVADALAALTRAGLPALEARMLVSHATGLSRVQLITQDTYGIDEAVRQQISELAARRLAGEPMAYLLGEREFFGRTFKVTPAVLIPRPETELLIDTAIKSAAAYPTLRAIDIGTGSGCIALALAHAVSPAALGLASGYVVVNLGYSAGLKHVAILDVFLIAAGFMLVNMCDLIVAAVAAFLAGPDSDYITGQAYQVDGGMVMV